MTISYKAAKKLKDAGFPQKHENDKQAKDKWACQHGPEGKHSSRGKDACDKAYTPDEAELKEAIGAHLGLLVQLENGKWRCVAKNVRGQFNSTNYDSRTDTPEEGLAGLWPALKANGKV